MLTQPQCLPFALADNSYSAYHHNSGNGDDEHKEEEDGQGACSWLEGGESADQWYLGHTQCFKANSAYSLYGILKDTSAEQENGSYCHKGTFINSFFTTAGVEVIAQAFGLGSYLQADDGGGNYTAMPSSQCSYVSPYDDDDDANQNDQQDDDGDEEEEGDPGDEDRENQGYFDYTDYTSYGTGCLRRRFVLDQFQGAFCTSAKFQETVDTFDTFNQAVESMGCTQIYSGSYNRERKLEDEEDYDLLSNSKACSFKLHPNECPDPYGLVDKYERNLDKALATKSSYKTVYRKGGVVATSVFSWIWLLAGIGLMVASFFVVRKTEKDKNPGSGYRGICQCPADYDEDEDEDNTVPAIIRPPYQRRLLKCFSRKSPKK